MLSRILDNKDRLLVDQSVLAGVDEAGRGPIAGEVYAAAVVLPCRHTLSGLNDSKLLSEKKRDRLFDEIKEQSLSFAIATASLQEIYDLNILHASMLAMKRAVSALEPQPKFVLVDGNRVPDFKSYKEANSPLASTAAGSFHAEALVKGDSRNASISAASVLAKVARDRAMIRLDEQYPEYAFAQHKGYPTKLHIARLQEYGVSSAHRRGFKPVQKLLSNA